MHMPQHIYEMYLNLEHVKVQDRYDETCSKHEGMIFYKGGVCDTHEIQGKSRESVGIS